LPTQAHYFPVRAAFCCTGHAASSAAVASARQEVCGILVGTTRRPVPEPRRISTPRSSTAADCTGGRAARPYAWTITTGPGRGPVGSYQQRQDQMHSSGRRPSSHSVRCGNPVRLLVPARFHRGGQVVYLRP
jgi:hypothetical protein